MTGEGKAKHKTEPRAGRGEAHRVRLGKAGGVVDARACLGEGYGRADDARTCQGKASERTRGVLGEGSTPPVGRSGREHR